MDLNLLWGIVTVIGGGYVMFIKKAYRDLEVKIEKNEKEIEKVKDQSVKKEDFTEFKQELWGRWERLEDKIDAKLL